MFFFVSITAHAAFTIANSFSAGSPISASQMNANFSGVATTLNGVASLSSGYLTGTLSVGNGGTGLSTVSSGAVMVGNGTSAMSSVAAGASGNVLVDNGTAWVSQPLAATTSLRSCNTGNSNDVMVPVGSWCVDVYQASIWSGFGGTGAQYFTGAAASTWCDISGAGCGGYAASKLNVAPAVNITWFSGSSGLCECWQAACSRRYLADCCHGDCDAEHCNA